MKTTSIFTVLSSLADNLSKKQPKLVPETGELKRLSLHNAFDPVTARVTIRKLAGSLGYSLIDQVRISTAIFEIARYIVLHAGQGEINISWREDTLGRRGLEFCCNDCGLNSPKLTSVLQAGEHNTSDKLNLLGLRRLVDEFQFAKDPEHGNCVTVIKWMA